MKTAILVDGGFYRRRAYAAYGDRTPAERADELFSYCKRHLTSHGENSELYRIFYYDCPPMATQVYHPLIKKNINFARSSTYDWTTEFFAELKACGGKFALIRFGTAEMGFNNGCINDYTQYANEKAELCRK